MTLRISHVDEPHKVSELTVRVGCPLSAVIVRDVTLHQEDVKHPELVEYLCQTVFPRFDYGNQESESGSR